jgi:ribosomal protein S18 acetylase RimI-like enzyme
MIAITPATLHDLQSLTELEGQLFSSDRISRRQFRYLLTRANSIAVKAEAGGRLLGYLVLLRRKTSRTLRIYSIGVGAYARNQGVAASLLGYAEQVAVQQRCNRLSLEVCQDNEAAIKLYKKAGFIECGQKKNYYEDGCTALLLQKPLPKTLPPPECAQ